MKRFFLAFTGAAVLALSAAAPPALANVKHVNVKNDSSSCAWITIYESGGDLSPWKIVNTVDGRPRFVKPAGSYNFYIDFPEPSQVKVRAEVKANRDCSGHQIADISDYRKNLYADKYEQTHATLSNPHGHYTVSIH